MKKCIVYFCFFLLFNYAAVGQMNALFDQTRTVFIENIEEPNLAVIEANALVAHIRTTAPDIGAFDEDQTNDDLEYDYADLDHNNCSVGALGGWEPSSHIENLARMAEGYALSTDASEQTAIADALILGLQYWYGLSQSGNPNYLTPSTCPEEGPPPCNNMFPEEEDGAVPSMPWCCDNWWWNVIGKQRELSKIGILFYDELTGLTPPIVPNSGIPGTRLLDAIIDDMPDDVEKYSNDPGENEKYTGANLTEVASFVMMKGILSHDYINGNNHENILVDHAITEFEEGALSPASEVACNDWDDGVQADYSFFQHDKILYSSGYGYAFIHQLSLWGSALSGNEDFFFDNDHQNFLLNSVLEGWRWMIRGNTADYSASGRYITRDKGSYHTSIPDQHMIWMIELAEGVGYNCLPQAHPNYVAPVTSMGIALEDMKIRAQMGQRQNISGSKYFWIADYVAHHEVAFFSSVKMCARQDVTIDQCDGGTEDINARTTGTESRNSDNRKGYWLPYGCTFIYQNGTEYDDLFSDSDWEWNKIPGVTSAELSSSKLKPGRGGEEKNSHNSNFVGSAGNGEFSVTTLELDKDHPEGNLQARKAWFHFGDEIIALGNGITDDSGEDVFTTMNQSHLVGDITPSENAVSGFEWIHHDNTAYIYPDPSVYTDYTDEIMSDDADDIFTACIEHEDDPDDASYFYRVVPGVAATEVSAYISNNPVEILEDKEVDGSYRQAVQKGDLSGIIHYPPTVEGATFMSHDITVGTQSDPVILSTNVPCALFFDASTKQICISSPDRSVTQVVLTVDINAAPYVATIDLPQGENAGTSTCEYLFAVTGNYIRTHCGDVDEDGDGLLDGDGAGVVDVNIYDDENNQPANLITTTNSEGSFTVYNITPAVNYTLDPSKDDDYYNGISSFDLVLMSKHILQIEALDTPYKRIAADVNKSGSITNFDVVELRKLILHIHENLPEVESWEFVDASHVFPTIDPFAPNPAFPSVNWPFPEIIELNNVSIINDSQNFTGIKMGDVSCSSSPDGFAPPCEEEVKILVKDKALATNELFTLELQVEGFDNIEAYQFALDFAPNKLEYVSLSAGELKKGADANNFNLSKAANGHIKTVWLKNDATIPSLMTTDTTLTDSSSLFLIQFKALEPIASLSGILDLNDGFLARAWASGKDCGREIKMEIIPAVTRDGGALSSENLINSIRVYPNPTKGELVFEISADADAEQTIHIYDPIGKEVLRNTVFLEKGHNVIHLESIADWKDGLYFYMLEGSSGSFLSGKFVKQ